MDVSTRKTRSVWQGTNVVVEVAVTVVVVAVKDTVADVCVAVVVTLVVLRVVVVVSVSVAAATVVVSGGVVDGGAVVEAAVVVGHTSHMAGHREVVNRPSTVVSPHSSLFSSAPHACKSGGPYWHDATVVVAAAAVVVAAASVVVAAASVVVVASKQFGNPLGHKLHDSAQRFFTSAQSPSLAHPGPDFAT